MGPSTTENGSMGTSMAPAYTQIRMASRDAAIGIKELEIKKVSGSLSLSE